MSDTDARWSVGQRIGFRFLFVWWGVLFCVPALVGALPGTGWLSAHYGMAWTRLTLFVARHLLHLTRPIATEENGSGDRLFDWVSLGTALLIALLVTVGWSVIDRRRPSYARLWDVLRTLLRYTVASILLGYGVVKLFGGQFPPPDLSRLMQPYGESSPMGLMWTFMGSSHAYVVFSGAGETTGALLLFSRRTATLGALVLVGVLTNVVMLNFCYDVPVKINSSLYLLMCLVIAAPDLMRLADVLVFQRPAPATPWRRAFFRRWQRIVHGVVKLGFTGWVLYATVSQARSELPGGTASWREGSWKVTRFVRGGVELPPLLDDKTRWNRIKFQSFGASEYFRWVTMNQTRSALFTVTADDAQKLVTLKPDDGKGPTIPLTATRSDGDHLHLAGQVQGAPVEIDFVRLRGDDMLLRARGFHFVNEEPFNR